VKLGAWGQLLFEEVEWFLSGSVGLEASHAMIINGPHAFVVF
jgi:hypothetical protein